MKKFCAGVAFGALILGLGVGISRGQESTSLQMAQKQIKQGSILNLAVTLDKAPNLDGYVTVVAAPDSGAGQLEMKCNLSAGQTGCEMGPRISLDEKLGRWKVAKVAFTPSAGGQGKELARHGDMSFQVVAHGEVILPDAATISDIR